MIMGCFRELPIGSIQKGLTDKDYKEHKDQPFIVLRKATHEEWIQYVEEETGKIMSLLEKETSKKGYFYEISLD